MSEQKKHPLMMVKDKRPMEQAESIAVRLVDVLPVIAKQQLKALAQGGGLCNHSGAADAESAGPHLTFEQEDSTLLSLIVTVSPDFTVMS